MTAKTKVVLLLVAVTLVAWIGYASWRNSVTPASSSATRKILYYQDSMHPWVKSDKPDKCPICAMNLTAVYEGDKGKELSEDMVVLSPNQITVLDVQTEPVERRTLVRTMRVAGTLDASESRKVIIAAPIACRIESLAVEYAGVEVKKGQTLMKLFTPELVQRRAYLSALGVKYDGPTDYLPASGGSRQPYTSDLVAPQSGTVIERSVYEGQYVEEGEKLLTIADQSMLWFRFDVYEPQLPWFTPGQKIQVTASGVPGTSFPAVISFLDPVLNDPTRTVKVRADIQNPAVSANGQSHRLLQFGMYAEGRVRSVIPDTLVVPRSAVLFPGGASYVYVDKGDGIFERRRVKLGRQGDDLWEVLQGLKEGEDVVSYGNLLMDAQAQFNQGERSDESGVEEMAGMDMSPAPELAAPVMSDSTIAPPQMDAEAATVMNEPVVEVPPPPPPSPASMVTAPELPDGRPNIYTAVGRVNARYARSGVRDEMRQIRIDALSKAYQERMSNASPATASPEPAQEVDP
jgi:membrane fusion protein, copper/silver efflux system